MATEAQINANRRNAQRSTGPTSAEGKAKSSRNGIPRPPRTNQHLLDDDDPGELLLLLQDLFSRFRPVGEGEEKLVLRIGLDQWRLDRAIPLEAGIYRDRFQDVAAKDKSGEKQYAKEKEWAEQDGKPAPSPPAPPAEGDLLARAFNADCAGPNSFTKLARYESHLERSIDRCLRQLKAYQAARNAPDAGPKDPQEPSKAPPDPPSTPSKTEDYEANPKNGGMHNRVHAAKPHNHQPPITSHRPTRHNHQPPTTSHQPRRGMLARHDLGLDAVHVVHGDGIFERGGHQHVALQLQQVLIGDEIAAGEADRGSGLILILHHRYGVEVRAVVDAALGVADGQDAGAVLVQQLGRDVVRSRKLEVAASPPGNG